MKIDDSEKPTAWAETLSVCEFDVGAEDVALMNELLPAIDVAFAIWRDWIKGSAVFRVYSDPDEEGATRDKVAAMLETCGDLFAGPTPELRLTRIDREDWSETWKEHFHAFRASRRLVVKPSWETFEAETDDIILEIDPGMTFGTGYHGTTKACLQMIDDLADELGPVSFLDAGCGSGILSLGAAKLGYTPMFAFDHDPDAVRMTTENLTAAGIDHARPTCADLADYSPPQPCRLVVVNILAVVILTYADRIVQFVDRSTAPGNLVLSGILTEQYPDIKARFEALGCVEQETRTIDEWTSGRFILS
ncbi:MAG: 50S ribosomal protein L11 methyltransferase [Lentisphaeria bacterium]|nr:50S ribosomal protein L11 methyltransferase [Lentisphaeria bacterium]